MAQYPRFPQYGSDNNRIMNDGYSSLRYEMEAENSPPELVCRCPSCSTTLTVSASANAKVQCMVCGSVFLPMGNMTPQMASPYYTTSPSYPQMQPRMPHQEPQYGVSMPYREPIQSPPNIPMSDGYPMEQYYQIPAPQPYLPPANPTYEAQAPYYGNVASAYPQNYQEHGYLPSPIQSQIPSAIQSQTPSTMQSQTYSNVQSQVPSAMQPQMTSAVPSYEPYSYDDDKYISRQSPEFTAESYERPLSRRPEQSVFTVEMPHQPQQIPQPAESDKSVSNFEPKQSASTASEPIKAASTSSKASSTPGIQQMTVRSHASADKYPTSSDMEPEIPKQQSTVHVNDVKQPIPEKHRDLSPTPHQHPQKPKEDVSSHVDEPLKREEDNTENVAKPFKLVKSEYDYYMNNEEPPVKKKNTFLMIFFFMFLPLVGIGWSLWEMFANESTEYVLYGALITVCVVTLFIAILAYSRSCPQCGKWFALSKEKHSDKYGIHIFHHCRHCDYMLELEK